MMRLLKQKNTPFLWGLVADGMPLNNFVKVPAYKEPWFWAVFAPLIIVAVVSTVFVGAAFVGADDRVVDDYYKQGRMINNQFDAEHNALAMAISGRVVMDVSERRISVELNGRSNPLQLRLSFSHPSSAQLDRVITVERVSPGQYRSELEQALTGRWYLIVSADETELVSRWRVSTELDFSISDSVKFSAHL